MKRVVRTYNRNKDTKSRQTASEIIHGLGVVEWSKSFAYITHPVRGLILFDPYWYQEQYLRSQSRSRIILKSRQIGFSQVFAIEAIYKAIATPRHLILMVSRNGDVAKELLGLCYTVYYQLKGVPLLLTENKGEMGLWNGSRIKSIPANRSTGRAFAAGDIYLDEFAYADHATDILGSIGPTISNGGNITIASTPNGLGNEFAVQWRTAVDTHRFSHPWYDCPAFNTDGWSQTDAKLRKEKGMQGEWYSKERPKYSAQQWASEYECDFVTSGLAVFSKQAIDNAEDGAIGDQPPQYGHQYFTSVDVGRRHDATVINVVDVTVTPHQRVFHERLLHVPYPVMQQRVETIYSQYGGIMIVESNGVGDPFIENLRIPVIPFVSSHRHKIDAITALQVLLEHKRIKARWTEQERRELEQYQWSDKKLIQDCVMSLSFNAYYIHNPHYVHEQIQSLSDRRSISRW